MAILKYQTETAFVEHCLVLWTLHFHFISGEARCDWTHPNFLSRAGTWQQPQRTGHGANLASWLRYLPGTGAVSGLWQGRRWVLTSSECCWAPQGGHHATLGHFSNIWVSNKLSELHRLVEKPAWAGSGTELI